MSAITQSVQPIVIPDSRDASFGPSGGNVPLINSTSNVNSVHTVASSVQTNFFTIASSNLTTSSSYRLTHSGFVSPGATVAGFINCKILLSNATDGALVIGGQAIPGAVANANLFVSMSTEFVPRANDSLILALENNTASSASFTWTLTNRGNALETVSLANSIVSNLYTAV